MNRLAFTSPVALLALSLVLGGCASSKLAAETPEKSATKEATSEVSADDSALADAPSASSTADRRAVGDYVTFAFSGGYRKNPITLTQRVTARTDAAITIEYAFTEKGKTETLRGTWSLAGESQGQLTSAARIAKDGGALPMTVAAFEEKISETVAQADQNEAMLGEKTTTVTVAGEDIAATTTTYKVRVGEDAATFETTVSPAFAWGDLGGKITKEDGKVFFEAKLVDAGATTGAHAALDDN